MCRRETIAASQHKCSPLLRCSGNSGQVNGELSAAIKVEVLVYVQKCDAIQQIDISSFSSFYGHRVGRTLVAGEGC
jgi:hypothetical protein